MIPQEPKSYLDSFINHELNLSGLSSGHFTLKRIEAVLEALGNPQRDLKCLHVAGSKGKGSTCAFAASILREAGYKVGLYTSPHLKDVNERIRVLCSESASGDGDFLFPDCISDENLGKVFEEIKPVLEKFRNTQENGLLTYYEVLTAAAFYYFRQERIDCAVLETGLGGRLDATNVVASLVCAITPISLEHTQILGNTIETIAKEKAAIIKTNRPMVIIAPQEQEALKVIVEQCQKQSSHYLCVGREIDARLVKQDFSGLHFQVRTPQNEYNLRTTLLGSSQAMNAATAVGMIEALEPYGIKVSTQAVEKGIAKTTWPGRCEVISQRPYIILDCAHNPASAEQLTKTIRELFPTQNVRLVFGVSQDKDRAGICRHLNEIAQEVVLTKADHPRSVELSVKEMEGYFPGKHLSVTKNVEEAMDTALQNIANSDVVLVAGSIFLVGQAREYLLGRKYATPRFC